MLLHFPDIPWMYPPRHHGKSHQPKSLWSGTNRMPATQNKKSKPNYLTGAKKENQINTWGGINRKTIAVDSDHNQKLSKKETGPSAGYPRTLTETKRKTTKVAF